jgi:hypothetical protein
MPRSKKPRKPFDRDKHKTLRWRKISQEIKDQLAYPAYIALSTLAAGGTGPRSQQEAARHDLAAYIDVGYWAFKRAGYPVDVMNPGLEALKEAAYAFDDGGDFVTTEEKLESIRVAVRACDDNLERLNESQLISAIHHVNDWLQKNVWSKQKGKENA